MAEAENWVGGLWSSPPHPTVYQHPDNLWSSLGGLLRAPFPRQEADIFWGGWVEGGGSGPSLLGPDIGDPAPCTLLESLASAMLHQVVFCIKTPAKPSPGPLPPGHGGGGRQSWTRNLWIQRDGGLGHLKGMLTLFGERLHGEGGFAAGVPDEWIGASWAERRPHKPGFLPLSSLGVMGSHRKV